MGWDGMCRPAARRVTRVCSLRLLAVLVFPMCLQRGVKFATPSSQEIAKLCKGYRVVRYIGAGASLLLIDFLESPVARDRSLRLQLAQRIGGLVDSERHKTQIVVDILPRLVTQNPAVDIDKCTQASHAVPAELSGRERTKCKVGRLLLLCGDLSSGAQKPPVKRQTIGDKPMPKKPGPLFVSPQRVPLLMQLSPKQASYVPTIYVGAIAVLEHKPEVQRSGRHCYLLACSEIGHAASYERRGGRHFTFAVLWLAAIEQKRDAVRFVDTLCAQTLDLGPVFLFPQLFDPRPLFNLRRELHEVLSFAQFVRKHESDQRGGGMAQILIPLSLSLSLSLANMLLLCPNEILVNEILPYLRSVRDLCAINMTCKGLYALSTGDPLWRSLSCFLTNSLSIHIIEAVTEITVYCDHSKFNNCEISVLRRQADEQLGHRTYPSAATLFRFA